MVSSSAGAGGCAAPRWSARTLAAQTSSAHVTAIARGYVFMSAGLYGAIPSAGRQVVAGSRRFESGIREDRRPSYNPRLMEDIMRIRSLAVLTLMVCGVVAYAQSQRP